jgi:hypothetical protein
MALTTTKFSLVLALAAIGVIAAAFGALSASHVFSNNGSLSYPPPPPPPPTVQIGVYSDSSCTIAVSNIAWGTLSPGAIATQTVHVKNEGSGSVILNMSTSNWNPLSALSYMALTWDKESYVLTAGSVVSAVLTLNVSSSITGITTFSFNTTITGTQ